MILFQNSRLWILFPALIFAGCHNHPDVYLINVPYKMVWEHCSDVVKTYGYRLEKEDFTSGVLSTEWRIRSAPYPRETRRVRIEITIRRASIESGASSYRARIKAYREANYGRNDYLHPDHAIWAPDGYDTDTEQFLLSQLKTKFLLKK